MPGTQNPLDEIANDLALWIDQTSTEIALAFAPTRAPFSANVTEEQKLEFYRTRLFNPDGTPNEAGRQAELQRLGTTGFTQVYKAVIHRYPDLRIPMPEVDLTVPDQWPQPPPSGGPPPPIPSLPSGPGVRGAGPVQPGPPVLVPPAPPMVPPPPPRSNR
jgi:hypothetical protein